MGLNEVRLIGKELLLTGILLSIKLYQTLISPLLPMSCRFNPTCSAYSYQAFKLHGLRRGLYLTIKRLLHCHPFTTYDPDSEH